MRWLSLFFCLLVFGCKPNNNDVPVIGVVAQLEDATLQQATDGFMKALADSGFSENANSLKVIYRNAQGDIPSLTQIVQYFISQKVALIATNPTTATIAAVQATSSIPVFMMVSPVPSVMNLETKRSGSPKNLYGVGEELWYIDTAFSLIPALLKPTNKALKVGMLYNLSEPQSVQAYERIKRTAEHLNITLIPAAVSNSSEVQLVTKSLLNKGIDAFFANPDNTVFASFETIIHSCNQKNVPVFTSESGLVKRGAVAAFGADMYQWGYDAGAQAAIFLKTGSLQHIHWKTVSKRNRMINKKAAEKFNISIPSNSEKTEWTII